MEEEPIVIDCSLNILSLTSDLPEIMVYEVGSEKLEIKLGDVQMTEPSCGGAMQIKLELKDNKDVWTEFTTTDDAFSFTYDD